MVLTGLLLLVGGSGAAVMLRSARLARSELHPPRIAPQRPAGEDAPAGLMEVTFTTSDSVQLSGWYVPSRNRAAVLLGHGFGGNRADMLPEARILAGAGFGVLLWDWRAHGTSAGELCTWGDGERRDVWAALEFLTARSDVDAKRLGGLGTSLGGVALVLAAAGDVRLAAVMAESVWTSFTEEAFLDPPRWGWISAWPQLAVFRHAGIAVDAIRPVEALATLGGHPLFLLYGGKDTWNPPEMRAQIAAAAPSATIWVVPEAAHAGCRVAEPQEYALRMLTFRAPDLPPWTAGG